MKDKKKVYEKPLFNNLPVLHFPKDVSLKLGDLVHQANNQ